jgi:hypothetical protein
MYCSACGQLNASNATICSQCGRAMHSVPAGVPTPAPVPASWVGDRVERHIQTVGILWLVYALMGTMGWFIAIPFLTSIFGMGHAFPFQHRVFPFMGFSTFIPFVTAIVLIRAGLQILTGIALLMRVRWGANPGNCRFLPVADQDSDRNGVGHLYALGAVAGRVRVCLRQACSPLRHFSQRCRTKPQMSLRLSTKPGSPASPILTCRDGKKAALPPHLGGPQPCGKC